MKQDDVASSLRVARGTRDDLFLQKLLEETEQEKTFTLSKFIAAIKPSGSLISRDSLAISQRLWTPPHIYVMAEVLSMKAPKRACDS